VRVGWKTWCAFALVIGAGLAVFILLPRWVEKRPLPELALSEVESPVEPVEPVEIVEPSAEDPEPLEPPPPAPVVEERDPPAPAAADPFDERFADAMTEALAALQREDYAAAREAFARAQSARPEAPEAASGIAQAEEGLRSLAIAGHQDRGVELERSERWRAAEAEYDAALALDSSLRFAREGKERSAAHALLQEKLDFQIGHPERLGDARALAEASSLLEEARDVGDEGPKRREAIAKLEALVSTYSRPMEVSLVSDTFTEVTLHRVGRLGRFDRKVLEVRPGRYVAVGSRAGFRDVRVEFTVEPGKLLAPIPVRCEEAI
jgi:hypothetical protein